MQIRYVSLTAYQPTYENGSYTFTKTKYKKDAAVNLTNINIDEGDSYNVNDYKDFSVAPDYVTYPQATTAPAGCTAQQEKYYSLDASNTYTYIFYDKTTVSSSKTYSVKFIYSASDPDSTLRGKQIDTKSVKAGTVYQTPPSMPSRTGYGTPYWVDSKNNVADFTTGVTINKDMVFSCVYPPVAPKAQFNVTFENINGSTFTTTKVYDGDFANDPGIPTDMDTIKQDFVKWVYKSDNSKGLTDVSITDSSVVFVPVVQNKHKVEFKLNGSLINASTIYVSDGQYANYPGATPVSSDANKVFSKWVVEGTADEITSVTITRDTVFEAVFVEKPSLPTSQSDRVTIIIDCSAGNNYSYMYGYFCNMNAKIVNETDNEVIVDNFTGNSNIDISKYKGRKVRYVITATIPYNVPCRVNLWEKEWQNIDNAFTNVTLTTSDLGKTYYVKMQFIVFHDQTPPRV